VQGASESGSLWQLRLSCFLCASPSYTYLNKERLQPRLDRQRERERERDGDRITFFSQMCRNKNGHLKKVEKYLLSIKKR
jgi:hypothetical protein